MAVSGWRSTAADNPFHRRERHSAINLDRRVEFSSGGVEPNLRSPLAEICSLRPGPMVLGTLAGDYPVRSTGCAKVWCFRPEPVAQMPRARADSRGADTPGQSDHAHSAIQVQTSLLQLFMHSLLKVHGSPGLPSEQKFSEIRQMPDMQSESPRQGSPTDPSQHWSASQ